MVVLCKALDFQVSEFFMVVRSILERFTDKLLDDFGGINESFLDLGLAYHRHFATLFCQELNHHV